MARLSNMEKETIITFDETPDDAYVFTYNRVWQKHIEKRFGIKPEMDNGAGGRQYRIPKKRIRMPQPPRKLSAETKKRMGERLRQGRARKSQDSVSAPTAQAKEHTQTSDRGKTIKLI